MKKSRKHVQPENSSELLLKNEIIGLILLFIAVFFVFSAISYNPNDPSFFNSTPNKMVENYGGKTGAQVSALLFNTFGFASFILLFYMLFMSSFYLINKRIETVYTKSAGFLLLLFSFSTFISNVKPYISVESQNIKSGGIIGYFINAFFQDQIKPFFTGVLFFIFMLISLILIAKFSLRTIIRFFAGIFLKLTQSFSGNLRERYEVYQKNKSIRRIHEKYNIKPVPKEKSIFSRKTDRNDEDKDNKDKDSLDNYVMNRTSKKPVTEDFTLSKHSFEKPEKTFDKPVTTDRKYFKGDSEAASDSSDMEEINLFPEKEDDENDVRHLQNPLTNLNPMGDNENDDSNIMNRLEKDVSSDAIGEDEDEEYVFDRTSTHAKNAKSITPRSELMGRTERMDQPGHIEREERSEKSFFEKPKPVQAQQPQHNQQKPGVRPPSRIPEETSLFTDFDPEFVNKSKYQSPPLSYLDASSQKNQIDYRELEEKKDELKQRLIEFKIRGNIVEFTPGPVITTYEFVPDTGVKVKDVTNLSEDLALVAKAQYVRIERILGKKAIGIEIPNKKREVIHLREVLESEEYQNSSSPLTIGIGKTKSGEIFISDLREMPHLIIAGATGSGKSVAIHTLLLSILYKASPDEVKFIMIDPKRVELALYNTLPHLLVPVVVNTKLAKNALEWSVFEMENRYKRLAQIQVRNIDQYNKKIDLMQHAGDPELDNLEDPEKLPYIVIVIDEFADLMMECGKEIENAVARIAQKARAVGIHIILATQRPSIDVITGTIKNNFPSRIALAVPSKHDSRTIIDVMGAEKLLGNGDMLFLPPKTATLVRLHCAYVSEEETLRVVTYLSKMGKPKFNSQVLKPVSGEETEFDVHELDELFYEAAEIVINTGQASASYLQRKMSIGYARAGRLIDQLQKHSVVSAPDSKSKREILMTLDELKQFQEGGGKAEQSEDSEEFED